MNAAAHDLVVIGEDIDTALLKALAKTSRAREIVRPLESAFRLLGADPVTQGTLMQVVGSTQVDVLFVPAGLRLADMRLAAFDMDSTVITIECIDELADYAGCKPAVADITASAMRGEIDFAESLRQRVALLNGLPAKALDQVYVERLQLSPGAQRLMRALQGLQIRTLLVSGGFTFFTERIKTRLGFTYAHANELEVIDEHLTGRVLGHIVDGAGKAAFLRHYRDELGLRPQQLLAVGDGANDLKMLAEASISVAYHAKPKVRAQARFAINHGGLDAILALFEDAPALVT